jgi:hypothetical protein
MAPGRKFQSSDSESPLPKAKVSKPLKKPGKVVSKKTIKRARKAAAVVNASDDDINTDAVEEEGELLLTDCDRLLTAPFSKLRSQYLKSEVSLV